MFGTTLLNKKDLARISLLMIDILTVREKYVNYGVITI